MRTEEHQMKVEKKERLISLYSPPPRHLILSQIEYYVFPLLFSFQTEEITIYLITHYEETESSFRLLTGTLDRDR